MQKFSCFHCKEEKDIKNFDVHPLYGYPTRTYCDDCNNNHYIEDVLCACSVCKRKLPSKYFRHYANRFKKNGMRLRTHRICVDCNNKESKILREIKKNNPPPPYKTPCPQCNRIVYEKSEDIPEGIDGANGPWQCDHDHELGSFRGYLCKQCNTGTGLIGDNKEYFDIAQQSKQGRKNKT